MSGTYTQFLELRLAEDDASSDRGKSGEGR